MRVVAIWKLVLGSPLSLEGSNCKVIFVFEVDMLKLNTTIIWTPTFEWYVVSSGSKSWYKKTHVQERWDYMFEMCQQF